MGCGFDCFKHSAIRGGAARLVGFAAAFAAGQGGEVTQDVAGLEPGC